MRHPALVPLLRTGYRIAWLAGCAYGFVARPAAQGAYAAVWWGRRLLVVENTYRREITLPSGGVHRGEAFDAAAARELGEEVGIRVDPGRLVFGGAFTRPHDFRRDTGFFFELRLASCPTLRLDPVEVAWAGFLTPEAIRKPNLSPLVAAYLDHSGL